MKILNHKGFTLLELVTVILLLAVLSVSIAMLWPSGMKSGSDLYDIKHAIRFAQHMAMTRPYDSVHPWGFKTGTGGSSYSILKKGTSIYAKAPDTGEDMQDIGLKGEATISCDKQGIWFNRFGTPLDYSTLSPISSEFTCTIGSRTITIHPETGYVE